MAHVPVQGRDAELLLIPDAGAALLKLAQAQELAQVIGAGAEDQQPRGQEGQPVHQPGQGPLPAPEPRARLARHQPEDR